MPPESIAFTTFLRLWGCCDGTRDPPNPKPFPSDLERGWALLVDFIVQARKNLESSRYYASRLVRVNRKKEKDKNMFQMRSLEYVIKEFIEMTCISSKSLLRDLTLSLYRIFIRWEDLYFTMIVGFY